MKNIVCAVVLALSAAALTVPAAAAAQSAEVVVPAAKLLSYAGTYQTEGPRLTIELDLNGVLSVTPPNNVPRSLRPVTETEFLVEGTPMRIVFHPENGKTQSITVHRGTRELHGQRVAE